MESKIYILFVCMGNICRSPTAQAVMEKLVADAGLTDIIQIDSAGTHAYHDGEPPDRRARGVGRQRGYVFSHQKARRTTASDFERFDYLLAMDKQNLAHLKKLRPAGNIKILKLFMEYAGRPGLREVPDPYYGGDMGFERVLDLIEEAGYGLFDDICRHHNLRPNRPAARTR